MYIRLFEHRGRLRNIQRVEERSLPFKRRDPATNGDHLCRLSQKRIVSVEYRLVKVSWIFLSEPALYARCYERTLDTRYEAKYFKIFLVLVVSRGNALTFNKLIGKMHKTTSGRLLFSTVAR